MVLLMASKNCCPFTSVCLPTKRALTGILCASAPAADRYPVRARTKTNCLLFMIEITLHSMEKAPVSHEADFVPAILIRFPPTGRLAGRLCFSGHCECLLHSRRR